MKNKSKFKVGDLVRSRYANLYGIVIGREVLNGELTTIVHWCGRGRVAVLENIELLARA